MLRELNEYTLDRWGLAILDHGESVCYAFLATRMRPYFRGDARLAAVFALATDEERARLQRLARGRGAGA